MAITKGKVAEAVRTWCNAWHTRDIETILAMEAQIDATHALVEETAAQVSLWIREKLGYSLHCG